MRILLADDHDLFREGFALVIQTLFPQIKVIEQVPSWQALQTAAQQHTWDLIILDVCMPTEQRWDVELEQLCAIHGNTKKILNICVVTSSTSARDMQLSFQLGVRGYFSKISDLQEVKTALHKVLAGQVYMPSSVWGISEKTNGQILVTERQKQVLNLLALGKSNKQIAQQLGVSESTIKRHVYNMYKIMSVNNRVEAIDYARQRGLILN